MLAFQAWMKVIRCFAGNLFNPKAIIWNQSLIIDIGISLNLQKMCK